jgi:hypothetical protein
VQNELP